MKVVEQSHVASISRAAGVCIRAPGDTESFCMSTTIIAVFYGSITSICMAASGNLVQTGSYRSRGDAAVDPVVGNASASAIVAQLVPAAEIH